jgi:hypothetical protein
MATDTRSPRASRGLRSLEIVIAWGTTILAAVHLTPPRPFHLTKDLSNLGLGLPALPEAALGAARAPLLRMEQGELRLVLFPGAAGVLEIAGSRPMSVAQAIEDGVARPLSSFPGAHEIRFPRGSSADIELASSALGQPYRAPDRAAGLADDRRIFIHVADVADVAAEVAPCHDLGVTPRAATATAATAAAHAIFLAIAAVAMPSLGSTDEELLENQRWITSMLTYCDHCGEDIDGYEEPEDEPERAPETRWSDILKIPRDRPIPTRSWPEPGSQPSFRYPGPVTSDEDQRADLALAVTMGFLRYDEVWGPMDAVRAHPAWVTRTDEPGLPNIAQDTSLYYPFIPVPGTRPPYYARVTHVGASGPIDPERIAPALTSIRYAIGGCIAAPLDAAGGGSAKNAASAGAVNIRFTIDQAGAARVVAALRPDGTPHPAARCVEQVFELGAFPAPSRGVALVTATLEAGASTAPSVPLGPPSLAVNMSYRCDAP